MKKENTGAKIKIFVIAMLAVSFVIPLGACSKKGDVNVSDNAANMGNTAAPWLTANQTAPDAEKVDGGKDTTATSEENSDNVGKSTTRKSYKGTTKKTYITRYVTVTTRKSTGSTAATKATEPTTQKSYYTTRDYAFTTAKKVTTTNKNHTTEEEPTTNKTTTTTEPTTTTTTTTTTTVQTTIDDDGNVWEVN